MATSVNSITYNGYKYSVGDIIMVNTEYFAYSITSPSASTYMANAKTKQWRIVELYVADSTSTPSYPVSLEAYSGGGSGCVTLDNIVTGSGGTQVQFTVTIDLNGGTATLNPNTNTLFTSFPVIVGTDTWYAFGGLQPTRTGYDFTGLWDKSSGGEQIYFADGLACGDGNYWVTSLVGDGSGTVKYEWVYEGNKTLYAQWDGYTYYIKYNGNSSTSGSMSNSTHRYGTASTLTSNAFKRAYTVTLHGNGTSNLSSLTSNYVFKNWNTKSDGSGTTLNNQHSITGLTTTRDATVNIYAQWTSTSVTLPTHSRNGYKFKGWNTKSDGSGTNYASGTKYTPTSNVTLYAIWEEYCLTVNYYSNNATSFNGTADGAPLNAVNNNNVLIWTQDYYYDNAYSSGLNNYSSGSTLGMIRTGYTATGNWGTSTNGGTLVHQDTGFSTGADLAYVLGKSLDSGNASVNVYAQWQANTYTVKYDANGGIGEMSDSIATYDSNFMTKQNTFKRVGYEFIGWNEEADGTGTPWNLTSNGVYENGTYWKWNYTHDVTLYAQWKLVNIAFYKINGEWKLCHTYIKVGGIWKPAIMYKKINGTWKRSVLK